MKIKYDGVGNILACCVDSHSLEGDTVITIADNDDVLVNISKYTWDVGTSSLVLRKSLVLTTLTTLVNGIPTVPADGETSINVAIQALNTSGAPDTSANFTVGLTDLHDFGSPSTHVTLSSGSGTVTLTSSTAKRMLLTASASGSLSGSIALAFN